MANEIISRLTRTMSSYFRIGTFRLKDSSGVVQARAGDDSAFADIAGKQVRVQGNNAANAVVLNAPNSLGGNVTLTLPDGVGATGQFLKTDGAGTLSWADSVSNADLVQIESFNQGTTSPLNIFTPPNNAVLEWIAIIVDSAAAGGNPVVTVGNTADNDLYMLATESDLKEAGIYMVHPRESVGATPDNIELFITPDAQTFAGRVLVGYSLPS